MTIKLALLGCGTIGTGFLDILKRQEQKLKELMGIDVEVCGILVRHLEKYSEHPYYSHMTTHFNKILSAKPDLIIEVMGGIEPAKSYMLQSMAIGAHIITANKDLLASHGYELFSAAAKKQLSIGFEASVGGGIPIIKPLKDSLKNGGIYQIEGIINGTTNYILSRMYEAPLSYEEALSEAQMAGFAEADPSSDVLGLDSMRKLCILSSLAFNRFIEPSMVNTTGIHHLSSAQVALAKAYGMKIKLVAFALYHNKQIYTVVKPAMIASTHPFYAIDHEYNGIQLYGKAFGKMQLSGKGAGKLPTANAVFGDFMDFCHQKMDRVAVYPHRQDFEILANAPLPQDWILQINNRPDPESLGRLLQTFADHKLSIHNIPTALGLQLMIGDLMQSELDERIELLQTVMPNLELNAFMLLK